MAIDDKLLDILDQGLKLRDNRSNWMSLWQECRDIFLPDAASFTTTETAGQEGRQANYTSLPELARRGLSTAIQAMMRPDGKRWFKAKPKVVALEGDEQARMWCDLVTAITYNALYDPRANATKVLAEADAGLTSFGTAVVNVGWDAAGKHLTFRGEDLKGAVLLQNKLGKIDAAWIFRTYTLRQVLTLFERDKLTAKMKQELEGGKVDLEKTFELCHVCIPNEDYKLLGFAPGRLPYASLWFSVSCRELIDKSGYWGFPYITPRWETLAGETYGRSPAMTALNDARALLKMESTFLDAGEMATLPPLGAWADLIRGDAQMFSGGLTLFEGHAGFQQSGPPMWPIQMGQLPREVLQYMDVKQQRVEAAFFRDILELPRADNEKMTAAEIGARHDQYIRQAAPVFSRIEANYNAPLIERVFAILFREGMFPDPPESLYGQEIQFEYESPLKTARDRADAFRVMEGLGMIQNMAAGLGPEKAAEVQDNIDVDIVVRYLAMKTDLPQIIMTPLQKMLEARDARAKQIKQAQMAEMASKLGPAIGQIGGAAAKAKETGMLGTDAPFPFQANDINAEDLLEGVDYQEIMSA